MTDPKDPFGRFRSQTSFFADYATSTRTAGLKRKLEDVLGPLSDDRFEDLRPVAENDFARAVSTFFEQSDALSSPKETPNRTSSEEMPQGVEVEVLADQKMSSAPPPEPNKEDLKNQWCDGRRYLGSVQIDAWCTRSGKDLAHFGEQLRISCERGDNNVVRLANSGGVDFARVREEDARYIAPLLAARVLSVDVTVIFADSNLFTGSSLFVQAECYLMHTAFLPAPQPVSKRASDESKETKEEGLVRLRQSALVALLAKLGIAEPEPDQGDEVDGELSAQQLDLFYRGAVADAKIEAEPASSFSLQLYPYQKRGLAWMLRREQLQAERYTSEDEALHPLWTELHWHNGDIFYANLSSGELSLERPTLATRSRGGILADEMGLGKTISALALIHTASGESRTHATLIVAPMSLLAQWESEVAKSNAYPRATGCLVYYGASQTALAAQLNDFLSSLAYDRKVVLTTYGTVTSEHKQQIAAGRPATKGLFNTMFDRIILDEAHTIKNRTTQSAKACFDLRGQRRWALTGTPVVNRLEDLYSLIKFIQIEPWDNFTFWRAFVTERFERSATRESAMRTVQAIVAPICLRRAKSMLDPETGTPLVELPEKTVEICRVPFTDDEQELYDRLYHRVRQSVQNRVADGSAGSRYSAILALLLRLRQVCCHPQLLRSSEEARTDKEEDPELDLDLEGDIDSLLERFTRPPSVQYTAETLKGLLSTPLEQRECAICSENQVNPLLTECLHSACRACLMEHISYLRKKGGDVKCHVCRQAIHPERLFVVDVGGMSLRPVCDANQSTKVRALIAALRQASPGKAVVFSQFTSFLDLIETSLREAGFPVFRFDGSMSQSQRALAVEKFTADKRSNAVFLLSLKAGGVGLNLVVAKYAYLMDPWWSYAVEAQAIDRIHRMGQTEQVRILRFIIEGSIEERMLKIQDRKRALSTLVTAEDRRAEQLEDIKLLLDLPDQAGSTLVS